MGKKIKKRWIESDYYHIGKRVREIEPKKFSNEEELQKLIVKRPGLVFELEILKEYYWIPDLKKEIDILSVDDDNYIHVIELKNGKFTERDVGQVQNYAKWVKDNLSELGEEFGIKFKKEVCIVVVCNDMTKSAQNTIEVITEDLFYIDVFEFNRIVVKGEEILEIIRVYSNYED